MKIRYTTRFFTLAVSVLSVLLPVWSEGQIVNCPQDITIECTSLPAPVLTGFPTGSGFAPADVSYTDVVIQTGCTTILERTWLIYPPNCSPTECIQLITITDSTPPTIAAVPVIWEDCSPLGEGIFTATDNCDDSPVVTVTVVDSTWVTPQDCEPGMYRTQTQGGWGTVPSGNNPGTYLHAHFAEAFPNGLTIGCTNTLTLTTAQAVTDFLPSGSSPALLPAGQLTNPGGSYSNVLAGQLVALTLSVTFDAANDAFGSGDIPLGQLQLLSGPFAGWTISELLVVANQAIGGCPVPYSLSSINNALSSINENFVDGTQDNGFVDCSVPFDCYLLLGLSITATDNCGNTSQLSQSVIIGDTSAPTFEDMPVSITVNCGEVPPAMPVVSDDCFSELIDVQVTETFFSGACLPTIERIYTATDQCGNSASFTQYIFVHDTEAPVFLTEPQDASIQCGEAFPFYVPEVTDGCDESPVVTSTEVTEEFGCTRIVTITWTATDECGNTAMVDQVITIVDNDGPVYDPFPTQLEIACGEIPPVPVVEFYDACGAVIDESYAESVTGAGCDQLIIRTWSASDECGNTTVVQQTITVNDQEAPVFAGIPQNVTLSCGAPLPDTNPIAIDNCSEVTISYSESTTGGNGDCAAIVRSWTATDACGNTAIAQQLVTIVDEVPPVLTGVPANVTVSCGQVPAPAPVQAVDDCDADVTITMSELLGGNGCPFTLTRTWVAADDCGNTALAVQVITIIDELAPVFTTASSISIGCNDLPQLTADVSDNCDESPELTFTDETVGSGCDFILTRTWTATDACGNSSSFVQVITVTDDAPPVFASVPPSTTYSCAFVPFVEEPVVTDNCSDVVDLEMNETQQGSGCQVVITRTWTATDACGNTSTAQQVIIIQDTTAPQLQGVPSGLTFECDDTAGIPAPANVTATDNCGGDPVVTLVETQLPGECPGEYTIIRTWTAVDDCGNSATGTQSIQVIDSTPPVFDMQPEELFVPCNEIPSPPVMSASDNCSGLVTITLQEGSQTGSCPLLVRTWVATDACGNSAQAVQFIHLIDTEAPVLMGIPPGGPVACNSIPPLPEPYAVDNCDDDVDISINETVVGSGCEYLLIRTYIAEDDCGNSTEISQSFTVTDETGPVFINPQPEITLSCATLDAYLGPDVMDDCGQNISLSYTQEVMGSGCSYDIQRTYTAADLCGHTASFTQLIHVTDNAAPVFSGLPSNAVVACGSIPAPAAVIASDACSGPVPVNFTEVQLGGGCAFQLVRTWTAQDNCGNTAIATQVLTVTDMVAPVLVGVPANISLACGTVPPPAATVAAQDNCTLSGVQPVVSYQQTTAAVPCGQVITRTWTATDACGNSSSASQQISILDTAAPVLSGIPDDVTVACSAIPQWPVVTANDACSGNVPVSTLEEVVGGNCPYTIIRRWIASDVCGNTIQEEQYITVLDEDFPMLSALPPSIGAACGEVPEVPVITATDGCMGNVPVVFTESTIPLSCGEQIVRTWTATDLCGHATQHQQVITVTDTEAPQFATLPEDLSLACGDAIPMFEPMVSDCQAIDVQFEELVQETPCAGTENILRIWTATDACGNAASQTQTITVTDTEAPMLLAYPADTTVVCSGIPEAPVLTGYDSCTGETVVAFTEEVVLLGEDNGSCVLDNAVNAASTVAIWLPNNAGFATEYVFGPEGGLFVQDTLAGTAVVTGVAYNPADATQYWNITINLRERRTWEEWSALGRSYKDDAGLAGDQYQEWIYFEMDEGSVLTGGGAFEGSVLTLSHAPGTFYYGFQLGWAANNRNAAYGMSGWFYYGGMVNGELMYGVGDLLVENECCPEQDIIRTWTTTDCSGNSTTHTQTIHVNSNGTGAQLVYQQAEDPNSFDVTGTDSEDFFLRFQMAAPGQTSIEMFDMNGAFIAQVWNGNVEGGVAYSIRYPKEGLSGGMYFFRLRQTDCVMGDREVVMH